MIVFPLTNIIASPVSHSGLRQDKIRNMQSSQRWWLQRHLWCLYPISRKPLASNHFTHFCVPHKLQRIGCVLTAGILTSLAFSNGVILPMHLFCNVLCTLQVGNDQWLSKFLHTWYFVFTLISIPHPFTPVPLPFQISNLDLERERL